MKAFVAIVKSTGGKLDKYETFDTEAEADGHVLKYGGFVTTSPPGNTEYWVIDPVTKTAIYDEDIQDVARSMQNWTAEIGDTDRTMKRVMEDLIDDAGLVITGRTKANYDAKKAIRARKPQ